MPKHFCARPGCGAVLPMSERFCEKHRKQYRKHEDQRRGSTKERGYAGLWPVVRRRKLLANPFCEYPGCQAQAVDVHHKVKVKDGGTHAMSNLMSVCRLHHNQLDKSKREQALPVL